MDFLHILVNFFSDYGYFAVFGVLILCGFGLPVPEDISLVSFDDNLYLDYLNPPVTRIAQPLSNIGIIAVKMLVQQIAEKTNSQTSILLQPHIVKRESVRVLSEKQ